MEKASSIPYQFTNRALTRHSMPILSLCTMVLRRTRRLFDVSSISRALHRACGSHRLCRTRNISVLRSSRNWRKAFSPSKRGKAERVDGAHMSHVSINACHGTDRVLEW